MYVIWDSQLADTWTLLATSICHAFSHSFHWSCQHYSPLHSHPVEILQVPWIVIFSLKCILLLCLAHNHIVFIQSLPTLSVDCLHTPPAAYLSVEFLMFWYITDGSDAAWFRRTNSFFCQWGDLALTRLFFYPCKTQTIKWLTQEVHKAYSSHAVDVTSTESAVRNEIVDHLCNSQITTMEMQADDL